MIETLSNIDSQLLLFFNGLHNSFFDFIMYWASNRWVWIPFYAYFIYVLYKDNPGNATSMILFIVIAVAISDQLASTIIKNYVMRLRPCHNPEIASQVHLVYGYCGGQYGFVSSHAANSFAVVFFLWGIFKKNYELWIILAWAILVSYSRIYLGAHYPSDVLGGAILGFLNGSLLVNIYKYIFKMKPIINRNE